MSSQNKPQPNETPDDRASEDRVEEAVEGTFPASDPTTTASEGARAVPPEDLMRAAGSKPDDQTVTIAARFDSQEAAKLALEALVRDGPVDRRCAEVQPGGDHAATVRIAVAPADQGRLQEMLRRQPGRTD